MKFPFIFRLFLLITLFIGSLNFLNAQSINPLLYQFLVRDAGGNAISNERLPVTISVFEEDADGSEIMVYSEEHTVETGENGLVKIKIGTGSGKQNFSDVIWNLEKAYNVEAQIENLNSSGSNFKHSSPLLFIYPGLFTGSLENLADPLPLNNNDNNEVYPLTIKDNKIYLSNGTQVDLPEYISNMNNLLIDVNQRNISCYGEEDGAVNVTVKGGTPPYDYYWSNGKKTEDLNNLKAGEYDLYVTDRKGFTAIKKVVITQPDPLEINFDIADVSDIGMRDGSIDLEIKGGRAPYSYKWSNGSYARNQEKLSPGAYKVTVTSSTGCSKQKTFLVREPVKLQFNKQNVSCYGGDDGSVRLELRGGLPPYEISWSSNMAGYFQKDLRAGKYYVFVKDSWGYRVVDSVSILQPYPLKVESRVQNLDKNNQSGRIDLNVEGGIPSYSYRWSTMDTSQNLTSVNDGVYSVTVTDKNDCESIKNNIFVYKMIEDKRDTSQYKVITIGTQVWMAENLNFGRQLRSNEEMTRNGVVEKYCYNDNPEYCDLLGGLYTWEEMMRYGRSDNNIRGETQGICPDGWHIPTNDEWKILSDYLGGEMVAAKKMKNYDYWTAPPDTEEIHLTLSGFSAYPAGRMDMSGESYYLGKTTSYWSSTKDEWRSAWHSTITDQGAGLYRNSGHIGYRFSVRCVKDYK